MKKKADKNSPSEKDFLVVGLGASAGGVKALQEFFAAMPPNSGMAFVVILHLSPEHKSNLAAILQTQTQMKVLQVMETMKVEPNHIYVIPPNQQLEMVDGVVRPAAVERPLGYRVAIDIFFRTLAAAYEQNAICIVLSGTGSDGTLGLKRVKESNGFGIVQDPLDAEYDQMPRSAIATQLADWILPVSAMPEKLAGFRESSKKLHLTGDGDADKVAEEINTDESLREILTLLRVRTGHDFSNYKKPTIVRRIARHLQIHELEDISSYLKLLQDNPDEIYSLLKNLLINVTNFFRDREAFDVLEREVIPNLFAGKTSNDQVRVWAAACASGEEAYSMAILLSEYAAKLPAPPKIQIFASDVDEEAISEARECFFPETIEANVSPERLKRFFAKEGNHYRIKKDLREMILFAPHNVLRDPPFSRLDLVSCRNLLIYLNRETQERVLKIFHFSLNTGGYLFLGSSESAESLTDLYAPVDKEQRIYSRRPAHIAHVAPLTMPLAGKWQVSMPETKSRGGQTSSFGELHYKLVEKYAPPSVLINENFDIIHLSDSAGRYLRFAGGEPSSNLLKAVHPDLLPDLRAALFSVQREHTTSEFPNVRAKLDDREITVNIIVRAVEEFEAGRGLLLVIFDEAISADAEIDKQAAQPLSKDEAVEAVVRRLEEDLSRTKNHLRSTIEMHEVSIEELKASNEELQAINEELRSASEELETSKEELQSVNEELTTVNHELKEKIEEVSQSNNDFLNLMSSSDIGTLFLDRFLNIKLFTPTALGVFNLIPTDIGRPLSDITGKFNDISLVADVETVLARLQTVEREIETSEGKWYLARISPYRTMEDRIDGVVVTFLDITRHRQNEEDLRESEERYRNLFNSIDEGFSLCEMMFDDVGKPVDYRFLEVNPAFEKLTGFKKAAGKRIRELIPSIEDSWFEVYGKVVLTGEAVRFENRAAALDSWYDVFASRVGGAGSRRFVVTFSDITTRKLAQKKLLESEKFVRSTLNSLIPGIAILDRDSRILDINNNWKRFAEENQCGAAQNSVGENYLDVVRQAVASGEADAPQIYKGIEAVLGGKLPKFEFEYPCHSPTEKRWYFMNVSPLDKTQGGAVISHTDITTRKLAELNADFLASVTVDLARLTTIDEMMETVGAQVGAFLNLSECAFFEIDEAADEAIVTHDWHRADAASLVGTYRISEFVTNEFHQTVRAGEVFVVRDTVSDSRTDAEKYRAIDVGAFASVPIIQNGEWRFLMVMFDSTARDWRSDEIELMRELTRRVWASIERCRAEAALRESEERLQMILESAKDYAIFTVTFDGLINSWSAGAERIFGYAENEIMGCGGEILFTPEDRAAQVPRRELKNAFEKGRAEDERWHVRKDGTRFYASGVVNVLHDGGTKGYGFVKIARDMTEKNIAEDAVRDKEMLQRIISGQEDERRRIARDIHDHFGQQITALRLKLDAIKKECADDEISRQIEDVQTATEHLDADVGFIAWELRPAALDDLGLQKTLANFVSEWSRHTKVAAGFHALGIGRKRLGYELETNLYRIAQEALNNIYKHAKATNVSVLIERRDGIITLIIEDDGIGFNALKKGKDRGMGLVGMIERAKILGGKLEIETEKGTGTTIFARVPVN